MGQQQLLLIVLSVIIVGIAVVVGINMFGASAVSANQDAVINDLLNFGSRAQQYCVKPTGMGGGGNSFANIDGFDLDANLGTVGGASLTNANGTYTISGACADSVRIKGVGVTKDNNGNKCAVTVGVLANDIGTYIGARE